jgi:hypothetical protein
MNEFQKKTDWDLLMKESRMETGWSVIHVFARAENSVLVILIYVQAELYHPRTRSTDRTSSVVSYRANVQLQCTKHTHYY